MTEHQCQHEDKFIDLAVMNERIGQILTGQNEIKDAQKQVLGVIFGNGKQGLKTQITRNSDAIKRQWWAIGIVIAGFASLGFYAIKTML